MFSLIITIISVALVAALALATLFYGGESYQLGQAKAEAAKLRNQGQQLVAAAEYFYLQRGRWPNSIPEMVEARYLSSIPVAQRSAVQEALAAKEWQMPRGGQPLFVFDEVRVDVCQQVNEGAYGVAGILPKLQPEYMQQCFGPTRSDLLVVVGRGSLPDLVGAVNEGLLVPENVSSAPVPSPQDPDAWTVSPDTGGQEAGGGGQVTPPDEEQPPGGGGDSDSESFTVAGISPATRVSGSTFSLYVQGTGFVAPVLVTVDGVTRSASVNADGTTASVSVPSLSFGTHVVTVSNGGGSFVEAGTLRSLVNLSSTSGFSTGGYSLTLTGAGFDGNTRVFFGETEAAVTAVTSSAVTVTVPAGPTNTTVAVRLQKGASASSTDLVMDAAFNYQGADLSEGTVTTLTSFNTQNFPPYGTAYSPAVNRFFTATSANQGLFAIDHSPGAFPVRVFSVQSDGFPVATSPSGAWVYFGNSTGAISKCAASSCTNTAIAYSGMLRPSGGSSTTIRGLRVSKSGDQLFGWASNRVFVRDLDASGSPLGDALSYYPIAVLGSGYAIRDVAFDADGAIHLLAYNVTTAQGALLVYSPNFQSLLGQRIFSLAIGTASPSLAITSDGRIFVALNAAVYAVPSTGEPTLYAGYPGQTGSADGLGSAARFGAIHGMEAVGTQLYVYTTGSAIRVVN